MIKTYFTPISSEFEYAGNVIMTVSGENPPTPPVDPPVGPTSPARKLYV